MIWSTNMALVADRQMGTFETVTAKQEQKSLLSN
jgi:hypothetical protein